MDNFMSDDFARALINTELGGYHISHLIGNGGMAVVFAATSLIDPKIKRALKVIRPHYAAQPRFVNRFSREALLLEQLHSPYIVGFHGVRRDRGHLYMELELLRGQDLRTLIESPAQMSEAEKTSSEPLRVVRWLYQAALGLADAHQMKVVHRDLKPANLFLCGAEMFTDQAERIKILDFGVAKVLDELESEQRHTLDGHVVGSPAFMAPEVCEGGSPTPQTDVYSLSLIGYQLLLGRHPLLKSNHRLNTMQVMLSHVQQSLPSLGELTGLPQGIEAVLLRGATRDPRARYRDGGELAHALGQVIETAERGVHPIFQPIHTRPGHTKSVEINAEHLFAEPTMALNDPLSDPNEPMNPIHSARARRNILISCLIFLTGALGWYAVISGSFDAWVESLSETGSTQLSSAQGDSAQGDSPEAFKRSPSSQGVSSAEFTPQRSRSDESPRALLERLNLEWVPLGHHPRSLMKSEVTVRQYELCQDAGACEQGSSPRSRGSAGLYGECITRADQALST